jgi:protocatechuate 3,4-dioxygenase beta subunit
MALILAVVASPQGGGQSSTQSQQNQSNQNNGQTQPPGVLTGQVISSTTGEPLRKVSLTVRPQGSGGSAAATTSDNSGNFRFATLDPGTYTLTGERTGYVRATLGEDRGQPTQITITSGQTAGGIQLKLLPHAVISGRIYDLDGDPVQGAQVTVMRYSYPRGQRQLTNAAQATTNDLGEYRVPALPPGRYYVSASDRGVLAALEGALGDLIGRGGQGRPGNQGGQGGPGGNAAGKGGPGGPGAAKGARGDVLNQLRNSSTNPEAYVTTYYPRTIDVSGATPLDLVAGSETRGIDIGLLKGRNYSVSGVIENVPGTPLPQQNQQQNNNKQKGKQFGGPGGVIVNLVPRTNNTQANGFDFLLGGTAQVNPDGSFTIRGVRPGAYDLRADSRGPQANRLTARVPVDVSSSDVTSVRARLTPPLEIQGSVAPVQADTALNLVQLRLNFVSTAPPGRGGGGQQQRVDIDANGKFQTTLDSDTYSIELQGAQNGYYLKTVKLAGREAVDNILDLTLNSSALEIVIANDSASITGTVQKPNGDPVQSARVTAVPANSPQRRDLYKSANSGSDGSFTLSSLPPGSYKVFAWEEVETNAWMDPEFRRPFETLGTTATIRDSSGPTLTLRVISKAQIAAVQ